MEKSLNKYVEFNGQQYPLFRINIVDQSTVESVVVSTESLSQQIIDSESGSPVNKLASDIDEQIFFYIPDELTGKTEAEVADFVSNNCW